MSVSLVLLPLAIALAATVGSSVTVVDVIREHRQKKQTANTTLPSIPTQFSDISLLEKTLREHGMSVELHSENELSCTTGAGGLTYRRNMAGEAFAVTVHGVSSLEELLGELECLQKEYGQNVQSYTYERLIQNLRESNMTLQSETVLEDNSILLTIDI